jgi:hypothetical protein
VGQASEKRGRGTNPDKRERGATTTSVGATLDSGFMHTNDLVPHTRAGEKPYRALKHMEERLVFFPATISIVLASLWIAPTRNDSVNAMGGRGGEECVKVTVRDDQVTAVIDAFFSQRGTKSQPVTHHLEECEDDDVE